MSSEHGVDRDIGELTNANTQVQPEEENRSPGRRTERTERSALRRVREPSGPIHPSGIRRRPRLRQSDRYMEPQRALAEGALAEGASQSNPPYINHARADYEHYMRTHFPQENTSPIRPTPEESIPPETALRNLFAEHRAEHGNDSGISFEEYNHNRRVKRRKVEQDSKEESWQGFRYGRYGQVEPGALKMEIVSCDGGLFQSCAEGEYGSDNILKDDDTVYCTKSNRCNIVLRHQGETTFSLTELVIKAPHKGFTAPYVS